MQLVIDGKYYTEDNILEIIRLNKQYKKVNKKYEEKIAKKEDKIMELERSLNKMNKKMERVIIESEMTLLEQECKNISIYYSQKQILKGCDVDMHILRVLNDNDLYNCCCVDKYLYKLCQNNKELKNKFDYTSMLINNPINKITKFNLNVSLYDLQKKSVTKYCRGSRILYQNINSVKLYLADENDVVYNKKRKNRKNKKSRDVIKVIIGPGRVTAKQLLQSIKDHLPEDLDVYGYHIYLEGFYESDGKYYLNLGS